MRDEEFDALHGSESEAVDSSSDVITVEGSNTLQEDTLTDEERERYVRLQAEIEAMITIEEERAHKTSPEEADDDLLLPL